MPASPNLDVNRLLAHYRTMARIRAFEAAAEQAILSGKERLDLQSFGDDLILPLVSMTQSAGHRRAGATLRAAG